MEPASTKIYRRQIDADGADSLAKIAQRIAPGSSVLDLGCGPGALAARLVADKRCVVDGVEGNPDAAVLAAPHHRKVVVADLEHETLAAHFADRRYDYIVCADVLEHLRHPEKLVAQLPDLLAPSGRILLSIPNVAYAGLIGALINGEFRYRNDGLLDDTHVRFFTRKSLFDFIARVGLRVTRVDTLGMPLDQSEFRDDAVESLPPVVLRTLLAARDALTYQFIVEAAPADAAVVGAPVEAEPNVPAFSFLAQLFYRGHHPFDAEHSATAHGKMGVERQRLAFTIPPSELVALRLDPMNRPGWLRLYGMALFTSGGDCVWRWDPGTALGRQRKHQLEIVRDEREGALLVGEGDDPWLELPVGPAELAPLGVGGTLEVELAWPESSDARVVIDRLLGRGDSPSRVAELTRLSGDMRAHIRTLSTEIRELQAQLRAARNTIDAINRSVTFRLSRPIHAIVNRLRRS